jgi:hypothetical protein
MKTVKKRSRVKKGYDQACHASELVEDSVFMIQQAPAKVEAKRASIYTSEI